MSHAEHHDEVAAEQDRPPNGLIVLAAGLTLLITLGGILGVNAYMNSALEHERERKIYNVGGDQVRQLHADEESRLSRYQWIDRKSGLVRIPVERALTLVLAERAAGVAPAPAPAPKAAPAPAEEKKPTEHEGHPK